MMPVSSIFPPRATCPAVCIAEYRAPLGSSSPPPNIPERSATKGLPEIQARGQEASPAWPLPGPLCALCSRHRARPPNGVKGPRLTPPSSPGGLLPAASRSLRLLPLPCPTWPASQFSLGMCTGGWAGAEIGARSCEKRHPALPNLPAQLAARGQAGSKVTEAAPQPHLCRRPVGLSGVLPHCWAGQGWNAAGPVEAQAEWGGS